MTDISAIVTGLAREGGGFGLHFDKDRGEWAASMVFGREAEDSPMAGGAAYGLGATADEAVAQILTETGWAQR